jgi:hypothetical protein
MRSFPVLLLGVALLGCSPSSSNGATTTVVTSAPTTASTTTTTLSPPEARSAFVNCLTGEGVELPADAFDADGVPNLAVIAGSLDTTAAAVQAAVAECSPLLSAAQAADLAADPEVRFLVIEQLHAFTRCMRDQGVTDFPEPNAEAPEGGPYELDDVPFDAAGFDEALANCHDVVGSFGLGN